VGGWLVTPTKEPDVKTRFSSEMKSQLALESYFIRSVAQYKKEIPPYVRHSHGMLSLLVAFCWYSETYLPAILTINFCSTNSLLSVHFLHIYKSVFIKILHRKQIRAAKFFLRLIRAT
jgi:hypothetical protein